MSLEQVFSRLLSASKHAVEVITATDKQKLKETEQAQLFVAKMELRSAVLSIEKALAQQEKPEHVAFDLFQNWMSSEMPSGTVIGDPKWWAKRIFDNFVKVQPPRREWVVLTEEDVNVMIYERFGLAPNHLKQQFLAGVYAADKKLKELNA